MSKNIMSLFVQTVMTLLILLFSALPAWELFFAFSHLSKFFGEGKGLVNSAFLLMCIGAILGAVGILWSYILSMRNRKCKHPALLLALLICGIAAVSVPLFGGVISYLTPGAAANIFSAMLYPWYLWFISCLFIGLFYANKIHNGL